MKIAVSRPVDGDNAYHVVPETSRKERMMAEGSGKSAAQIRQERADARLAAKELLKANAEPKVKRRRRRKKGGGDRTTLEPGRGASKGMLQSGLPVKKVKSLPNQKLQGSAASHISGAKPTSEATWRKRDAKEAWNAEVEDKAKAHRAAAAAKRRGE